MADEQREEPRAKEGRKKSESPDKANKESKSRKTLETAEVKGADVSINCFLVSFQLFFLSLLLVAARIMWWIK